MGNGKWGVHGVTLSLPTGQAGVSKGDKQEVRLQLTNAR